MNLPTGSNYNSVFQNLKYAILDEELKNGDVETDRFGCPRPYSGAFTMTYKITTVDNKVYACRCFTKEIQSLQKRYQAINNFINKYNLKYLVETKYLTRGIIVENSEYPIIKMAWIEGELLNTYVEKNFSERTKMEKLFEKFEKMVYELERFGVAHGDLQCGNIIIKNDEIFLIDYDGIYLPELSTLNTNRGFPDFQHPKRSNQYNEKIDRFSEIVIYFSLKALSIKPSLLNELYYNGDNIIFKASDFKEPLKSGLFRELLEISELKDHTKILMSICTRNFDKIPNLKDFILKNVEYERVKVIKVNGTNLSSYNNPFDFLEKSQQVREEKEFREEQKNYPLIYLGELDNLWRCIIYKCQIIGKIVDCTTNSLTLANKLDGVEKKYHFILKKTKFNLSNKGKIVNIRGKLSKSIIGDYYCLTDISIDIITKKKAIDKGVARKDTIEKELTEEAIKKGLVRDFCNKEIYVINFLKKLLGNSFVQLLLVILLIYLIISYYYGQHEEYIQEQVKNCTLYPGTFYSENIGCECPPPDYAIENRLLNPKENYVTWKIMVQYCTNIESTQKAENIKCNEQFPGTMFYIIDGRCKCPGDGDGESTYNESKKSC